MSTYLQLCADVQRECDVVGTEISAVTNQTGELLRIVNWVKNAWIEIQNRHTNWRWMRSRFTVSATASDGVYAGTDCTDSRLSATITRFGDWWLTDDEGFPMVRSYLTSAGVAGETLLRPLSWQYFYYLYRRGTQTDGVPAHVSADPQNNLVLGPVPSATYTVSGEYQMSAQVLAANSDEPEMPSRFHQLIVYEAMKMYAGYESAPEVMTRGVAGSNKIMRQLEASQLPAMSFAGPLA